MLYRPPSVPSTPRSRPVSSYFSSELELSSKTDALKPLTPNTRVAFQWPPPPSPLSLQAPPKPKEEPKQSSGVLKATEPKLNKAFINQSLSSINFPNAKTPPPQLKQYQSTATPQSLTFRFPPPSNKSDDGTLTAPVSPKLKGLDTVKAEKSLSRHPKFSINPIDKSSSPSSPLPSPTVNRNSYNRYRNSTTPSPTVNFGGFFPSLPTSPRPKPATLSTLSKPEEFKIQRPQLSPVPLKADKFLTVNKVVSFAFAYSLAGEQLALRIYWEDLFVSGVLKNAFVSVCFVWKSPRLNLLGY